MTLHITADVANALGFYVYAYIDPRDLSVFYIGKGIETRVSPPRIPMFSNIIQPKPPSWQSFFELADRTSIPADFMADRQALPAEERVSFDII